MKKNDKDLSQSLEFHMKNFSVLDVQEKERQRIARDLHDTSLQNLTHLVHKVELASLYMDQDLVKAKLELATIESGLRKVMDEIRNIIYDLRPMTFDDLGIRKALLKFFSIVSQESNFEISSDIDNIDDELSDESDEKDKIVFIMIYRIIQECVYNAVEHSKGNVIHVSLKRNNENFLIEIKDNGIGFSLEEAERKDKHFGLIIVKERVFLLNGKMKINTDNGASIFIEIPKKKKGMD